MLQIYKKYSTKAPFSSNISLNKKFSIKFVKNCVFFL